MTQEQYNGSIETGELQLSASGKISYYFLVILLLLLPFIFLGFDLFDKSNSFIRPPILTIIIPAILALLLYLYQRQGLKFKIVETKLSKNDLLSIIKQLCDDEQGGIVFQETNVLIAKTNINNAWRKSRQITLLFDGNKVFVNSIYDTDTNRSSVDLLGSNNRFVTTIIDSIQKAQRKPQ